ncbi:PHP-like protein [Paenibacillus sp. J31TS4]|uniref:PHP domain-containing protein n=1 Tax=Paenibacillus sp. J31TS4 TaxID=2807195 RepID=UPI001B14CC94|nr:PHP domain-containing protein [Paenibacillus sp. J31TS4]GIP39800.1 PHP-like protein [Paenibacillus sp. J31TS4]
MSGYADLHTHTTASDGTQPPAENVRLAKEAGLAAIGITDHDTVAGIQEAVEEGEKLGIKVVPGVEISTVAGGQDIHVLGYGIDERDPVFLDRLRQLRDVRETRNEMMIARLNELGLAVTMEEVLAGVSKTRPDETIGRPHIAQALIAKGYVSSMEEAFERYLGKTGVAYVNPPRIHPSEAIRWIHEAGGTAVLAHPGLYHDDPLVDELIGEGLDGIEAYHSDHTPEDEAKYASLANRHGLLVTAGSDYHGERHGQVFHGPIGNRRIAEDVVEKLLERRREDRANHS